MTEYIIRWHEPTEETIEYMSWWVKWLPRLFAPGLRNMDISFSAEKLDRMSVVIGGNEDSVCTIVEKDESGASCEYIAHRDGLLKAEVVIVGDEKKVLFTEVVIVGDEKKVLFTLEKE